ncbi:MAG: glycoside hydrolase family 97 protein [Armatimonadota bacterium]|nr:glycoside hydrolase family 97 protein [Armatimonadota bacterium]
MIDSLATVLTMLIVCCLATGVAQALEVKSPDGQITLALEVQDFDGAKSCPVYSIRYNDRIIVAPSRLGLQIETAPLQEGLQIVRQTQSSQDTQWKPVYGERSIIRNHYNQVVVDLKETSAPQRVLQLTLRVYNEGAAFCYTIPQQAALERVVIAKESTEFRFPADHTAWETYRAQGKYEKVPLSQIRPGCERPLVIRVADDLYAALAEARLVDYARMKFAPLAGKAHSLVADLSSSVTAALPLRTPWRVVMLAASPSRLLENNDIILNLNDPCAIADTSWIKPGKVIRETTLSTAGGKACVDFAVKHSLQDIEFDAGWYGKENEDASDPRKVANPERLDLPAVIRYARDKGIGILLYVNRRHLERDLDDILPLYRQWGVQGIKYGFVNVGSQQWTSWLHEAIRKTAAHQLVADVHDEYRPTGYSRTYPNLLTQEGIHGDEESPANTVTLDILFTRMLAGAADNTICYYDARVERNANHAYQLAKAVCFYSPLQFLYWYDRPAVSNDEPELEFFDHVPTVWDDTKVLHGEIGEYGVIARRSGASWFIGYMNSGQARSFDVPLTFLDAGKKYVAHIYSDDPAVPTRTHVRIDRFAVDSSTVLKLTATAQGGQAIRIVPATATDEYSRYR